MAGFMDFINLTDEEKSFSTLKGPSFPKPGATDYVNQFMPTKASTYLMGLGGVMGVLGGYQANKDQNRQLGDAAKGMREEANRMVKEAQRTRVDGRGDANTIQSMQAISKNTDLSNKLMGNYNTNRVTTNEGVSGYNKLASDYNSKASQLEASKKNYSFSDGFMDLVGGVLGTKSAIDSSQQSDLSTNVLSQQEELLKKLNKKYDTLNLV